MSVPYQALNAFGVRSLPTRLAGGEERTYRAGDIVLRRENATEIPDAAFAAELLPPAPEVLARGHRFSLNPLTTTSSHGPKRARDLSSCR